MRNAIALVLGVMLVSCGGGGGGDDGGNPPDVGAGKTALVLAANDLGMHCIDREFSVFSILPPFNVVQAQVVRRGTTGRPVLLTDADVELTYEAVADATGSINSTSLGGKTGFWDHATALFGANPTPGQGLTGLFMPTDAAASGPQAFDTDAATGWFHAFGIPITPVDDAGRTNPFPLLRITARDRATGVVLGFTDIVVPVASETDCSSCHATGGIATAAGGITWSASADLEIQTKENVLLLHDSRKGTNLVGSQPVLCASCHYSAALDLAGSGPAGAQVGKPTLSSVMHRYHGMQTLPGGAAVFPPGGTALETCYQCHPGRITQCQRGAMRTGGMECHSCHGDMLAVGRNGRAAWTDLPQCGSCHTGDANAHVSGGGAVPASDGIRLRQAWMTGDADAMPITPVSSRFAEESGKLYRKSVGHGGLACTACHGSPHAVFPNSDPAANDNVAATSIQGHAGTIIECSACHAAGTLSATMGGPHGMHNVADPRWTDGAHGSRYEQSRQSCTACHGADLTGTVLSRAAADRVMKVEDAGTVRFTKGQQIGCGHCHGIPGGGGGGGDDD